ncbi:hypothetical protein KTT56_00240 [Pseudomonas viridiflava]|uniref:hypothetical protein n=1 Tax=Pseudomonas viridiflava TaxID=33069 RepID=UPI001C3152DB|nr:hypothetical protein [Pseudomonas viridiflava]QXG25332.1 hypothetical protein KTT56_00240 [Pseudomonas viridiflava]
MSNYNLLFTYSISPRSDTVASEKAAARARRAIADMEYGDWLKIPDIETAITGKIHLSEVSIKDKRRKAEDIVQDELIKVLKLHEAYSDTWTEVALMVDGLGECILFRF